MCVYVSVCVFTTYKCCITVFVVCRNMFKSCSLNITGVEIPMESDGDVLDMTIEEQIGLCR